jgi:hypothetical protein
MAKRANESHDGGKLLGDMVMADDFLAGMHCNRPFHLVAIGEGQRPVARTFDNCPSNEVTNWIAQQNDRERNIYWHVAELDAGVRDRKAKKNDVARVHMLHVDVDDPSEAVLEKLTSFEPKPTAIIFSGGGFQAFWRLKVPTEDLAKAEAANKWLAEKFGGDHCHNVDRIMRVPGTINWPTAKKREAGRTPVMAHVL